MRPLAVYVHIPFCTVKCGYCDFNAYAGMEGLAGEYGRALVEEVRSWGSVLGGRDVATISFGGGTPGEFPAPAIAAVIGAIASAGRLMTGAEVSLEANPGTTTLADLHELRAAGVTRISFGAQSFDPAELHFLDRIHSPEATAQSVALARQAGFDSVNLDLIYGLPGQSLDSWARSLARAIELRPDHLSCYGLTIEEGTPLARKVAAGAVVPIDPDVAADMYELTERCAGDAGFRHYELSNWCHPGHESRHNLTYWTDGEYLGIGAGAHGYLRGPAGQTTRYENIAHPREYVAAARAAEEAPRGFPATVLNSYEPARTTAMVDWFETALRLVDGFSPDAFTARFGVPLAAVAGTALGECRDAGLVDWLSSVVRLTARGRLLHGEICARFLAHLWAEEGR